MDYKKIFFIFAIFLFFITNANAFVVLDLSQQIEAGNQKVIEDNAKLQSEVTQLKVQMGFITTAMNELNETAFRKDDIELIPQKVNESMAWWQKQFLVIFLVIEALQMSIFFFGKSKGWW